MYNLVDPVSIDNLRPMPLSLALLAFALFCLKFVFARSQKPDSREPSVIPTFLPYLGHVLNLLRRGNKYFEDLWYAHFPIRRKATDLMLTRFSNETALPIFTLHMLTQNVYVVNSPPLITAAERASKTLSIAPLMVALCPRFFDVDDRVMAYLKRNADLKEGHGSLIHDTSQGMQKEMAAGSENLELMIKAVLERALESLNGLDEDSKSKGGNTIQLFAWLRRDFAVASTSAIYGPLNPFAEQPSLAEDFWTFDKSMTSILFAPFPRWTARKAWQARERLTHAFNKYMDAGGLDSALGVFRFRHEINTRYGATKDDISRFELGDIIGVLVNATPAIFWATLHIYSDPSLLQDLRDEIKAATTVHEAPDGYGKRRMKYVIDTKMIASTCPLLLSTFRETLRIHTHNATNRMVIEDTLLDDRYLLRKGGIVQMPSAPVHYNTEIWGPDATAFNARRFLKTNEVAASKGAFKAWGGGATICPGRHFATAEVTGILAMMVARFDVEPTAGKWLWPMVDWGRVASSIHPPKGDISVKITARAGFEGTEWAYAFGERARKAEEAGAERTW